VTAPLPGQRYTLAVGQLVTLCAAPNEYIAIAYQRALRAAGISCVQFTCEIPFYFGFNYGAGCYASILVDAEDEPRARAVVEDAAGSICGEEHAGQWVFPITLNLRGYRGLLALLLTGGAAVDAAILVVFHQVFRNTVDYGVAEFTTVFAFTLIATPMLIWGILWVAAAFANRALCWRILRSMALGLLALVPMAVWLSCELVAALVVWLWRLPKLLASLHSDW